MHLRQLALLRSSLNFLPIRTCSAHLSKDTAWLSNEGPWSVKLEDVSAAKDKDPIIIQHCLQAVCDGDHYRTREFFTNGPLNLRLE